MSCAHTVGLAFDRVAAEYDHSFTHSSIGRAQRSAVWRAAKRVFAAGSHLLELNCGTGEDAEFLASCGHTVLACDASAGMIEAARRRGMPASCVTWMHLSTERIDTLLGRFGGVFSNFSGLNCIEHLNVVAAELHVLTTRRAPLLLCFSTRFCLWEVLWYSAQGRTQKATRRWPGRCTASLSGVEFPVFYPTLAEIKRAFRPYFQLRRVDGIGVFVPPSYVEAWMARHPRLLRGFEWIDRRCSQWPLLRLVGDHMLLEFERVEGSL